MAAPEPSDCGTRSQPSGGRLAELLPFAEDRLGPALAGPPALSRLRAAAAELPLDVMTAFEARLGRARELPVDLSIRVSRSALRRLPAHALPPHLGRFSRAWRHGAWPGVRWLWLEYDLDRSVDGADGLPPPSVAADLASGAPDPLMSGLFAALAGNRTRVSHRRALRRTLRALPPEARTRYVFSMLSRPGRPERIEIGGLGFDALHRYVERVAGADAGRAVDALRTLATAAEPHHLSLDVGDEVLPRFGVDCSFRRLPRREPRWRALFDGLVAAGLCLPEERDAVLAWSGAETFRSAPLRWPDAAPLAGAVARAVSHVKLIAVPGRPPEAKVYLMLQLLAAPARGASGREGRGEGGARSGSSASTGPGGLS